MFVKSCLLRKELSYLWKNSHSEFYFGTGSESVFKGYHATDDEGSQPHSRHGHRHGVMERDQVVDLTDLQ